MAKRSTKIEKQKRVTALYQMILRKKSRQELLGYGSEKWGLRRAQIDNLITEARKKIDAWQVKDIDKARSEHLARLYGLWKRAKNEKDGRLERMVLDDISEFEATKMPQKVAPTSPDGTQPWRPHEKATDDELESVIDDARRILQEADVSEKTTNGALHKKK